MNFNFLELSSNSKIKTEKIEDHEQISTAGYNQSSSFDNDDTRELFNSTLVEDLNSNEKVLNDINRFIANQRDKLNKKNLVNYCGILDQGNFLTLNK